MDLRRITLRCGFLPCLALAAGCSMAGGPADRLQVVQIASTQADLFGVPAPFRALHVALEKKLDRPVSFPAQPDGEAIGYQLAQGRVPFAILTASEFARIKDPAGLTLLATAVNTGGKTTRKGKIIIKGKSHLKTIQDCAGKRFAFGHHQDLVTDYAARTALVRAGVPLNKLLPELVPTTPLGIPWEGRLYCGENVPGLILLDLTINAGVMDEAAFDKLPETGGNALAPSKDLFEVVGETPEVPERVVVAGPAADPELTQRLKEYLLNEAGSDPMVCEQMGVRGFAPADPAAYAAVRELIPAK